MHLTVGVRIAVTLLINRFCNLDLLADDPLFYADRQLSGIGSRLFCTILESIILAWVIKFHRFYIGVFLAY